MTSEIASKEPKLSATKTSTEFLTSPPSSHSVHIGPNNNVSSSPIHTNGDPNMVLIPNNYYADPNFEYSTNMTVPSEYKEQSPMLENWDSGVQYGNSASMIRDNGEDGDADDVGVVESDASILINRDGTYYTNTTVNSNGTVKITDPSSKFPSGHLKFDAHQQQQQLSQSLHETIVSVDPNNNTSNSINSYLLNNMMENGNSNANNTTPPNLTQNANTIIIGGSNKMSTSIYNNNNNNAITNTQPQSYMSNVQSSQIQGQIPLQQLQTNVASQNVTLSQLPSNQTNSEGQMPVMNKQSIIIDPNSEFSSQSMQSMNQLIMEIPNTQILLHETSNNTDYGNINNCDDKILANWNAHFKNIPTTDDDEIHDYSQEGKRHWGTGRKKIEIKFIEKKLKRQITFSKRKAGMMKKIHELATLTGAQALLVLVSETGHIYSYATSKLNHLVADEQKNVIRQALDQYNLKSRDNHL